MNKTRPVSKHERFDFVARYMSGETLQEIGITYGYSKGRCHGRKSKRWFKQLRHLIVTHGIDEARRIYFSTPSFHRRK